MDIYEEENHYTFKAELPGLKKEDIKISFNLKSVSKF
ncbi:MAG: Hsp20 family protein [Planctomycetota bacterium]